MQIREAEIYSFGKFREQKFRFEPGINVIYGANEAGKSTLHAFLTAMLFGMEKGRGRASQTEGYLRYEPWYAPAYYSGALRFEVDGRPFYLERNFYHKEKRDYLRNEADGEELSVAYGDLTMLLGGIQKETFGNTYDIPQSGAVTGRELADSLAEYLSDVSESGNSGFRVTRATETLREKKRKLTAELKNVQEEKSQRIAALSLEQELLQQDLLKLREDIGAAERRIQQNRRQEAGVETQTDAELQGSAETQKGQNSTRMRGEAQAEERRRRKRMAGIMMILTAVFLAAALAAKTVGSVIVPSTAMLQHVTFVLALLAGAAGIATVYEYFKYRRSAVDSQLPLAEELPDEPQQPTGAEQILMLLRETAEEKEIRLYNIAEQLEQLSLQGYQEQELQQEIDAVTMASVELERLARELCEEAGDTLNAEVSRYISAITQGRYDSVRVDEKGKLWALINGREVPPDALSRGTLEQFYLALRLAAGKTVTKEEPMPIFLDDTFALYDDDRLRRTLQMLSGMKTQILLFTCQKREEQMLSEIGAAYHVINLKTDERNMWTI